MNNSQAVYFSSILSAIPGVVHGFSTRALGDMRNEQNRKHFMQHIGIGDAVFVQPQQVHGNKVAVVQSGSSETKISGVDGLVHKAENNNVQIALGVRAADCVPLLFVDPTSRIIGVAHAGWRGTLAGIAGVLLDTMRGLGAESQNIYVAIGPHIGMCCYSVPKERADQFVAAFGTDERMVSYFDNAWHLDVGYTDFKQLTQKGVLPAHIDSRPTCTSCQNETYYSYRKETKESFGEIMGVVTFTR